MATVLFAGGGTGGHLFPALAVAERLPELIHAHFACSNRDIDRRILSQAGVAFTPLSVRPLPRRPLAVPGFLQHYFSSIRHARRLINEHDVRAIVSMGGFVSGPAVEAARRRRIPTLLVNLDAVPGIANRYLVRRCQHVFSVYPSDRLPPRTRRIAMPLRRAGLADRDPQACRRALDLAPEKPVLLVTGASQGAKSINQLMAELVTRPDMRRALEGWSVLHLAGHDRDEPVRTAYAEAGVAAKVLAFCDEMGLAWGAAELAISRAGANSVGEVAANAVPTVFLPYPYHADQHQKHNAAALAEAGGVVIAEDAKEPRLNADRLQPLLSDLIRDAAKRQHMRDTLLNRHPGDGAQQIVDALTGLID